MDAIGIQRHRTGFAGWEDGYRYRGTGIRTVYPEIKVGYGPGDIEVTVLPASRRPGNNHAQLEEQTVQSAPLVGENLYASVGHLARGNGLGASLAEQPVRTQGTNRCMRAGLPDLGRPAAGHYDTR